jgi:Surface presentation of antigens protein
VAKVTNTSPIFVAKITEGLSSLDSRVKAQKKKLAEMDTSGMLNAHAGHAVISQTSVPLPIKWGGGLSLTQDKNPSGAYRSEALTSQLLTAKPWGEQPAANALQHAGRNTASVAHVNKGMMPAENIGHYPPHSTEKAGREQQLLTGLNRAVHITASAGMPGNYPERAGRELAVPGALSSDKKASMETAVNTLDEKNYRGESKLNSHETKPVNQDKVPETRMAAPADLTAASRMPDMKMPQPEATRPALAQQQYFAQVKSNAANTSSTHNLQYNFSQWGSDHHVAISMANPGSTSTFHPSDTVVHQRMTANQWDDKAQQNRWTMSDADEQGGAQDQSSHQRDEGES